jgi:hypothetical protein
MIFSYLKGVFSDTILKFSAAVFLKKFDSKRKFPVSANRIESVFSSAKCFGIKIPKVLFHGTEFRVVFSFEERFQQNPRVCFYFVQN